MFWESLPPDALGALGVLRLMGLDFTGLGFRVWGLGFGGLGSRAWGLGFKA